MNKVIELYIHPKKKKKKKIIIRGYGDIWGELFYSCLFFFFVGLFVFTVFYKVDKNNIKIEDDVQKIYYQVLFFSKK